VASMPAPARTASNDSVNCPARYCAWAGVCVGAEYQKASYREARLVDVVLHVTERVVGQSDGDGEVTASGDARFGQDVWCNCFRGFGR
jgi:hypothetical protein